MGRTPPGEPGATPLGGDFAASPTTGPGSALDAGQASVLNAEPVSAWGGGPVSALDAGPVSALGGGPVSALDAGPVSALGGGPERLRRWVARQKQRVMPASAQYRAAACRPALSPGGKGEKLVPHRHYG